ncbi:MAG: SEC-C metal-binding domain-containing protein, partial [Lysobacteraceae bacterium]
AKQTDQLMAREDLDEAAKTAQADALRSGWQALHDQVVAAGGLHIIGTERHESRRIDNQLRGRSGRQGDPGSSRFYLSLEDNLMRIFASDWVQKAMARMGMQEDEAIESGLVTRQIENAQRKVEAHNFDIRKNLLDFDDVANDQRKVVYEQRNELLDQGDVDAAIAAIRDDVLTAHVRKYVPVQSIDEQWDLPGLEASLRDEFTVQVDIRGVVASGAEIDDEGVVAKVLEAGRAHFGAKEAQLGPELMRQLEKQVMLSMLDQSWKEHLARMDYLRQGIHLRSYAQKQPKQEYKREAFELFEEMLDKVKRDIITLLARVRIRTEEEVAAMEAEERRRAEAQAQRMQFQHPETGGYGADEEAADVTGARAAATVAAGVAPAAFGAGIGRNEPCPCGSGKKYKHCHGQAG